MLKGNLINIRVLEKEDVPIITQWSNDPNFGGEFEPLEQNSLQAIEKWYDKLSSQEKWFIIEKKDGTKIGQLMYTLSGLHYTMGYTVLPHERRKGYCTEAVNLLVDYLFLSTRAVRIEAGTSPQNTASHRVLEKAGFTKEGVKRKVVYAQGKWHDEVIYGILREEWKTPKIIKSQ
jgi:RimJ/RimL family protein N-acetyltransferase